MRTIERQAYVDPFINQIAHGHEARKSVVRQAAICLARSLGVKSWTATNEEELDAALGRAGAYALPSLIEAKIDRSNYGATLRAIRG